MVFDFTITLGSSKLDWSLVYLRSEWWLKIGVANFSIALRDCCQFKLACRDTFSCATIKSILGLWDIDFYYLAIYDFLTVLSSFGSCWWLSSLLSLLEQLSRVSIHLRCLHFAGFLLLLQQNLGLPHLLLFFVPLLIFKESAQVTGLRVFNVSLMAIVSNA